MKTYTLITISKNTNRFGLREHLFLAPDGTGWRALRSAYTPDQFKRGDQLEFDGAQGPASRRFESWECCVPIAACPPAFAAKVIAEAVREAESQAS